MKLTLMGLSACIFSSPILQINLLFLINIVRIVLSKLRSQGTSLPCPDSQSRERAHIFKALRATMILFPLLGITNLLFFINPKNGTHDKIYMLFNATMQSSQVWHRMNQITSDAKTIIIVGFFKIIYLLYFTCFHVGNTPGNFVLLFKFRSAGENTIAFWENFHQPRHYKKN